jgi:hypothetical protein
VPDPYGAVQPRPDCRGARRSVEMAKAGQAVIGSPDRSASYADRAVARQHRLSSPARSAATGPSQSRARFSSSDVPKTASGQTPRLPSSRPAETWSTRAAGAAPHLYGPSGATGPGYLADGRHGPGGVNRGGSRLWQTRKRCSVRQRRDRVMKSPSHRCHQVFPRPSPRRNLQAA